MFVDVSRRRFVVFGVIIITVVRITVIAADDDYSLLTLLISKRLKSRPSFVFEFGFDDSLIIKRYTRACQHHNYARLRTNSLQGSGQRKINVIGTRFRNGFDAKRNITRKYGQCIS